MPNEIGLQPKQTALYELILYDPAVVIGVGGGRGAAKSSGADRVAITLMYERKGYTVCMVMRTWVKQMVPFHLEPIRRDFPWLRDSLTSSPPAQLRIGASRMEFKYAENYDRVEEAFRSGNYDLIIIDQAEQFSWREIVEIRKAARSRGGLTAKVVLLFNMRGSHIQDLRKVFQFREVARPQDFVFLKVNPWDNVEWVRAALATDGLTEDDYYRWPDEDRKAYAAERGPYTQQLATDNPAISQADWEGGWNSIEGAFFAHSYDRESTLTFPQQITQIQKPWDKRWMSQDWGKSHYCVTLWHSMSKLAPSEAKAILNWDTDRPLKVICTYRQMVKNEMTSEQIGQAIVDATPIGERKLVRDFFLSPDAFGERDSPNTIADNEGKVLRRHDMPYPVPADTDRPGGWTMMDSLLMNTKTHGQSGDTIWLISSECPDLLDSIPILMRDPKDLDVVLKTDKGQARLEQDVSETARYGLKSFLGTVQKPFTVTLQEKVQSAYRDAPGDAGAKNTAANMVYLKTMADRKGKTKWARQY